MGSSRPPSPDWGPQALDAGTAMLQKMGNLLLVLSHADTAVKGHLCKQETLMCQFELMQAADCGLLLMLLKSLKHLTFDPSTLPALQVSDVSCGDCNVASQFKRTVSIRDNFISAGLTASAMALLNQLQLIVLDEHQLCITVWTQQPGLHLCIHFTYLTYA